MPLTLAWPVCSPGTGGGVGGRVCHSASACAARSRTMRSKAMTRCRMVHLSSVAANDRGEPQWPDYHRDAQAVAGGLGYSGRGGGDGGGGVERVDRRFADEEAEDLSELIPRQTQPIPVGVRSAVLLLRISLLAIGFAPHQLLYAAAEPGHDLEQLVPEFAVAEAWNVGEIEADIEDGAPDRAAACLALEILQRRHDELGIIPAGGAVWT